MAENNIFFKYQDGGIRKMPIANICFVNDKMYNEYLQGTQPKESTVTEKPPAAAVPAPIPSPAAKPSATVKIYTITDDGKPILKLREDILPNSFESVLSEHVRHEPARKGYEPFTTSTTVTLDELYQLFEDYYDHMGGPGRNRITYEEIMYILVQLKKHNRWIPSSHAKELEQKYKSTHDYLVKYKEGSPEGSLVKTILNENGIMTGGSALPPKDDLMKYIHMY